MNMTDTFVWGWAGRRDRAHTMEAFAGVVGPLDERKGECHYFQDRNKRWPFRCADNGRRLLLDLVRAASRLVAVADRSLDGAHNRDRLVEEGVSIYARKPNKKTEDVTWSQDEYDHIGFQREYLRFKSVQRFTETFALLERAFNAGAFAAVGASAPDARCRVASLGGGPGFELVAVRAFFRIHFPHVVLELVSLDLASSWAPYCAELGVDFAQWDVNDGDGLLPACKGPVDFAIISYVLHHYMSNGHCAAWLGRWLAGPRPAASLPPASAAVGPPEALGTAPAPRAVFISSRYESLRHEVDLITARGVRVYALMGQAAGSDHRQLIFHGPQHAALEPPAVPIPKPTFPNVPYEEHKRGPSQAWRVEPRLLSGSVAKRPRADDAPAPPDPADFARARAARLQAARDRQAMLLRQREEEEKDRAEPAG